MMLRASGKPVSMGRWRFRPRQRINWLACRACLHVLALVLAAEPLAVRAADSYPWNAYIGASDRVAPWGGFVRGLGRGKTGLSLSGRDSLLPRSSGPQFDTLMAEIALLPRSRDLIIPVGGLLSAGNAERTRAFMTMIEADRGEIWRRAVGMQARRLTEVAAADRVYWQVGNEINSALYARSLRLWRGEGLPADDPDQAFVIPLYVEYFLAPTVSALNATAHTLVGRDDGIPIVLGTIAGAFRQSSRAWLDALLAYRVRGDFAPELAGRSVNQLVDIVAIHYLQTHADGSWAETLDEIRKRWVGVGRVKGVWATEELGIHQARSGIGAATAIRAVSRCLDYHLTRGIAPRQGRCGLWGWWLGNPGTRGDEAMTMLADFLGEVPIAVNNDNGFLSSTGFLEWHAFATTGAEPRTVAAVFAPSLAAAGRLTDMIIAAPPGNGRVRAEAYRFGHEGRRTIPLSIAQDGGAYRVHFPAAVELSNGAALLILITADGASLVAPGRKG